jgi:hypothetical protein
MRGTRYDAKSAVPSARRSARKRVGSDAGGGKADGMVAAWQLFGTAGTHRWKAPLASSRSSVVRCFLEGALVAARGTRGRTAR